MSQIIIIEPNQNLQELIALNLRTYVGAEVIPRDGAQDTIALIGILPSIDMVICRHQVGGEKTAQIIAEHINQENLDIHMIILGEDTDKNSILGQHQIITNTKDWEKVITSAARTLGHKNDVLKKKKAVPDFIPIPLNYFYQLENTCCDVFIRIKKGPGDFQFVKRIHSGDSFSKQMIHKYEDQGLKHFYIPKEMQKNFTNFVSDQLVQKLALSKKEGSDEEFFTQMDSSLHIALNEIKRMGFTSATIQLTDTLIQGMIETVENSSEMSPLLRKVINTKATYLYQHCHLTTVVVTEMLKTLKKDTAENLSLMAYACFFKDIALGDNPELAKISTQKELDEQNLEPEEWGLVMNHAAEGAQIVRKHPEAPIALDSLILTHHGSPDGRGFFTEDQDKLAELTLTQQLFVLCSDFVKELLVFKDSGGPPRPIVEVLKERYPQEAVKDIINIMEKTLTKGR